MTPTGPLKKLYETLTVSRSPLRAGLVVLSTLLFAWWLAPTELIAQRQAVLDGRVGRYDYGTGGHYEYSLDEGSGSVVIHSGGSTNTIALTGPSFSTASIGSGYFDGDLTYEYTETYSYFWVPDISKESDEPVDTDIEFQDSAELHFTPYSGAMYSAGSATATASVNGESVTAGMTTETVPPYSWRVASDSSGSFPVRPTVHMEGYTGQFTLNYAGSMSTGGNSAIIGQFALSAGAGSPVPGHYIYITSPKAGSVIAGRWGFPYTTTPGADLTISGKWKSNGNPNLRIHMDPADGNDVAFDIPCGANAGHWNPWNFDWGYNAGFLWTSQSYTPHATLQYQNPVTGNWSSDGTGIYTSYTRFKIVWP